MSKLLTQVEILYIYYNTQVPSSDVITSLCVYSSVSEAWKVCVYVNVGDVKESLIF